MNTKLLLLATFATGSLMAATMASAGPTTGTITINGALTADTCVVQNATAGNITVTLPTLPASQLGSSGATAGDTPFHITLTGCPTGIPVRSQFSAGSAGIATNRLNNAGTATNVQVQFLNASGSPLQLSQATAAAQGDTQVVTDASTGNADLSYTARYYANGGAAGAGSVTSNAVYTIVFN